MLCYFRLQQEPVTNIKKSLDQCEDRNNNWNMETDIRNQCWIVIICVNLISGNISQYQFSTIWPFHFYMKQFSCTNKTNSIYWL